MTFSSHEDYIAQAPEAVRAQLLAIQSTVEALLPQATRCIAYNMPAYRSQRVFFYFAAFKKHIGIYPPVTNDALLIEALAHHRGPTGNLSFALSEPLPLDLISRVALALHRQYCP